MNIAFFGTPDLATIVLDRLDNTPYAPTHIVTAPDRPVGRHQALTPPPVKEWAIAQNISYSQPGTTDELATTLKAANEHWDLFIVFAYGAILPRHIIELPTHQTLNLHPSLLPLLRGPSPIRSAIYKNMRLTGATIMLMDEAMDHGPILTQALHETPKKEWPPYGTELDHTLVTLGADLLVDTIPGWLDGTIEPQPQDDTQATYCQKLTRQMGELSIDPFHPATGTVAEQLLRTIRAFAGWPETYFIHDGIRIKIKDAKIDKKGTLRITRIVPAGKPEMDFRDYFNKPT